jgi:spermidine synthase
MLPWVHLDSTTMPGGGELRLMQRGNEYSIMSGAIELMNSRLSGSEVALATTTCGRISGRRQAQVLIGGLGMGFTLRAALGAMADDARIVVAELVPAVVAWARGPLAPIFGESLLDGRVEVREGDVESLIGSHQLAYDAILLDVDNGPEGLTRRANDRHAALRLGGVLAVWSSGPDPAFTRRLRASGLAVEELKVRANGARGARHIIWLATKPR